MSAGHEPLDPFVLEALPEDVSWNGRPGPGDLAALPGCAAVYLLIAEDGAPVQLATTQQLRRLAVARFLEAESTPHHRADLAEIVRRVRWRRVHSSFEGRWWYYRLARVMYPRQYRRMISFGPAWFLHVDWSRPVPEIDVTEHAWEATGERVGPWVTHDSCTTALTGVRDLFDLCRYPEQVRRAPSGQRCAYADMGRCDAPCDGSATMDAYVQRNRAAWAFVRGGVRPWIDDAKQRMKQAAAEQRFELAAQLKHQIVFAWKWHDRWLPHIKPAEQLNFLLALPATRRRAAKVFLFRQGDLLEGPLFTDRHLPTAVTWLRDQSQQPIRAEALVRTEQTWLLAHFLESKEGDASLVHPLGESHDVPGDLADALRQWARKRRAAPASADAMSDEPVTGTLASAEGDRKSLE